MARYSEGELQLRMAESIKPGVHEEAEQQALSASEKPALDEATFQQLLEAAHVLQEQQKTEAKTRSKPDPTEALAQIVATQEFLRSQPCDLNSTANVIVEQLRKITSATGVAIAMVKQDHLEYSAATGDAADLVGSRLPMDASLSADGQLSTKFSRDHASKNSMALSLLHDGKLAGLLEVRFADAKSIPDPEMRSCQLMAGLMTEAITRANDQEWKQTLAAERAAMLEALERIKPQLERLAVEPAPRPTESAPKVAAPGADFLSAPKNEVEPQGRILPAIVEEAEPTVTTPHIKELSARSRTATICAQCGYQFGEHELFCGRCGTARPGETSPSGDLQSKWASMWHMQQAEENRRRAPAGVTTEEEGKETDSTASTAAATSGGLFSPEPPPGSSPNLSPELEKMLAQFSQETAEPSQPEPAEESSEALVVSNQIPEIAAPVAEANQEPPQAAAAWGSATNARKWLESLDPRSPAGIWLAKHRADIYVGAAVILLLLAWGMHSPENHGQAKNPSQPSLTLFEKMMVSLGLAETPAAPTYLGNPNAKVWVDMHTALYYCADSELYGKTAGGKFTSQRDAQLDQFEPAARKNCD